MSLLMSYSFYEHIKNKARKIKHIRFRSGRNNRRVINILIFVLQRLNKLIIPDLEEKRGDDEAL